MNDEILTQLVERAENRYFGKYRGQVTNNVDPRNLGRIKASVPYLLGGTTDTGWALPAFAYGGAAEQGLFLLPDVGAGVWIEFEAGDPSYPIWSGTWYPDNAIPEAAKAGKKVLKTKTGHKIVLDDDAASIEIVDATGNSFKLDKQGIALNDSTGNSIKMEAEGITIQAASGSTLKLTAAGANINDGALTVLP
jgi:type VI secretion system secreted protein VgrG